MLDTSNRYIAISLKPLIREEIYATRNNLISKDLLYFNIHGHKCHGHYFHGNDIIDAKASRVRVMSVIIISDKLKHDVVLAR